MKIPQYLFYPSIDPLADKNRDLEPEYVDQILQRYGIDRQTPDPDPDLTLRSLGRIQWASCAPIASSNVITIANWCSPAAVRPTIRREARCWRRFAPKRGNDPDIHVLELPASVPLEINALQRASTIVIQKSLREGFGLTVAEALWKKKPVVASAVGGIPLQMIHKHTGLLAHSVEGTAYQIRFLLSHPEIAQRLGEQGREHVRENFLITGNVRRYLTLFLLCSKR